MIPKTGPGSSRVSLFTAKVATLATLSTFGAVPALAVDYTVDAADAAFLLITKKEGVASGFAHDHLIAARDFKVTLSAPEGEPEKGTFTFEAKAAALSVDAPDDQAKHFATLKALGIQKEPFSTLSESDRAKIKENALDSSQLDAKRFPEIKAEVFALERKPSEFKGRRFSHFATVRITAKGKMVEKRLPANVSVNGREMSVESVGPFTFSEFGITPYSAMFGAVRNADPIHIYVAFKARAK